MALPGAQLGSLPSMSMPSYVPVHQVHKEPKAWEKALLAVLANVAGNVASQGVANVMQPDYAPTEKAGLGEKFMSGPRIPAARAQEMERQSIEQDKVSRSERQAKLDRMVAMTGQNKNLAGQVSNQIADVERLIAQTQHQGVMEDADMVRLKNQVTSNRHRELQDQITNVRQGRVADSQIRAADAETGLRGEQSRDLKSRREFMERELAGKQNPEGLTPRQVAVQNRAAAKPAPQSTVTRDEVLAAPGNAMFSALANTPDLYLDGLVSGAQPTPPPQDIFFQQLVRAREAQRANPTPENTQAVALLQQKLLELAQGQ
jgi:hypothetical protein